MMILVTGGRGAIARASVAALRAAGADVRVASRQPRQAAVPADVPTVAGDLARPEGWAEALDGVDAALLYADPAGVTPFLEAARASRAGRGIHLVLVSGAAVDPGAAEPAGPAAGTAGPDGDPIERMHRAAEQAVHASGLPWTVLRPGALAGNTLRWAPSVRAERVVRATVPGACAAPVHEADIADIAALALTGRAVPDGRCHWLTGPASLSQREQVAQIADAVGAPVRCEEADPDTYRRELARSTSTAVADTLLRHLQAMDGRPAPVSPAYRELTGHEPRNYRRWVDDHVDEFR